jgi:uncharacterized protein YdeI (YjbR/CyaY-like superfamily)
MKTPNDLQKALRASSSVEAKWNDLTPIARRDFIGWVESARQSETRARRVKRVGEMLLAGKRRPCCYSIVPMKLYKALGADPKAKSGWSALSPDERRDFVAWVEEAKESEAHKKRIEKACELLAAGKKQPKGK